MIGTCLPSLSACGIYIHDERLVAPATAAEASISNAASLAPFDDQLTKLAGLAGEEDLVVARYWTNARDAELAYLISARPSTQGLSEAVTARLGKLGPASPVTGPMTRLHEKLRVAEAQAASVRRDYERIRLKDDKRALGCSDIRAAISRADANSVDLDNRSPAGLARKVAKACYDASNAQTEIESFASAPADGEISAAGRAYLAAAASASQADLSPYAADLKAQIKAAEDYAKKGAEADLARFHTQIGQILAGASDAAKLAGWQEVDGGIEKLLRAQICSAKQGTLDSSTLEAADCSGIDSTSTTGRAKAAWALASAVAQLIQANNEKSRSAQWLLAAKAIVAGEVADAKLTVAQSKSLAAAHRRRFEALLIEGRTLKTAEKALAGSDPTCTGAEGDCAIAAYAQAWNDGRIPGEVLEYLPVQIEREYAVRRAKAATEKQRALALAGLGAIKAKAVAGIKPEEFARGLLDAGLIGATWRN
jgi:hypothetical protein